MGFAAWRIPQNRATGASSNSAAPSRPARRAMSEMPPPDGINCRRLRRLRARQFIPSYSPAHRPPLFPSAASAEDASPSVQASLRLRSRLAARRPTGSLALRLSLRLNAWTRDCGSQRTTLLRAEHGFKAKARAAYRAERQNYAVVWKTSVATRLASKLHL